MQIRVLCPCHRDQVPPPGWGLKLPYPDYHLCSVEFACYVFSPMSVQIRRSVQENQCNHIPTPTWYNAFRAFELRFKVNISCDDY